MKFIRRERLGLKRRRCHWRLCAEHAQAAVRDAVFGRRACEAAWSDQR